jgi:hypothetical protein
MLASGLCALALLGCSSDNNSGQNSDGGTGAAGGEAGSGGQGVAGSTTGTGGGRTTGGNGGRTTGGSGGQTTGGSGATASGGGNGNGSGGANAADAGGSAGRGGRTGAGGIPQSGGATGSGGATQTGGASGTGGAGGASSNGWLHTSGNKILLTTGGTDTQWVGRGVNIDDIYMCGYNSMLTESTPDKTLESVVSGLMSAWKPNFVRTSLAMATNSVTSSFLTNPSKYKDPMVAVINAIGANPGVYVLVTLRSDASMIGQDETDGDPEATGIPSDSTTTPDKAKFPSGTDPVYQALVDTFANSSFVMFGLTNEPGGKKLSNATISAAMDHAVATIRAEEDKLGTPHHIVSVQGQGWTSDISFYGSKPLARDNVVYEVHGYPPSTDSYTYSNIPVIIGEYGTLSGDGSAFFADVDSKNLSSLAFDFEPFSDCAPDLLTVNHSATQLQPTAWGNTVKAYLLSHAK